MKKFLKQKIIGAPHAPGVYLFKGKQNRILYIGKASDLKSRLASYLSRSDQQKKTLFALIKDVDIIITNSDTEALTLEESLIKMNNPRYNVRLRDDKKFPYLKLTIQETYPRIFFTRDIENDGSLIFGPYTNARALRQTHDALCKIFKLVSCTKDLSKPRKRPCLEYNLNRCSAPCTRQIDEQTYKNLVSKAVKFLTGKSDELEKEIEKKMWRYAEKKNFEAAAALRNQLMAIRNISQRQQVVTNAHLNEDVIGISRSRYNCVACLFRIRESRLIAKEIFHLRINLQVRDDEIAGSLIRLVYTHLSFVPEKIVISPTPSDWPIQRRWFFEKGFKVTISTGKGDSRRLLKWAQKNAASELARKVLKKRVLPAILELQDILHLHSPPRWIEAFDISNLKEKYPVGASVSFYDGRPFKQRYRRYKIKHVEKQNDFAMIQEIVFRRIRDLRRENHECDLLLIDGGKGQLGAALKAIKSVNLKMPVFALAKKNEELFDQKGNVIALPVTSRSLILLKRIRNEAHRFAINYHRSVRGKNLTTSILDRITGIGLKRKLLLLNYFGSVDAIKKASEEDIARTPGIGIRSAKIIYETLHS